MLRPPRLLVSPPLLDDRNLADCAPIRPIRSLLTMFAVDLPVVVVVVFGFEIVVAAFLPILFILALDDGRGGRLVEEAPTFEDDDGGTFSFVGDTTAAATVASTPAAARAGVTIDGFAAAEDDGRRARVDLVAINVVSGFQRSNDPPY
jgi:hypothetical protein